MVALEEENVFNPNLKVTKGAETWVKVEKMPNNLDSLKSKINSLPAEFLEMPKLKKGKRRSLTDEEREHFYKVCNQDKRFMLFEIMLAPFDVSNSTPSLIRSARLLPFLTRTAF